MNVQATVIAAFSTPDAGHFMTREVPRLEVELAGIPGDRHYGFTRPAGARERWYKTGTPIRSGRQLSLVSASELAEVARRMAVPEIAPSWLGANVLVADVPDFSCLPWGTRLFFGDGAVLVNEGGNAPCRYAGAQVALAYPDRSGLDMLFVKAAKDLRGIVASVERAGVIVPGPVLLKIPPQKPWTGGSLC